MRCLHLSDVSLVSLKWDQESTRINSGKGGTERFNNYEEITPRQF